MQIADNHVVTLHYTVKTQDGDIIDESQSTEPLAFIQGSNFMIAGLEDALYGKQKSEKFEITVEPEQAYGHRQDALVQAVPASMFEGMDIEVGMSFRATTDQGEQSVIIIDKTDEHVTVDGNHPLSSLTLTFDVSIEDVREASAEELEHGHVHGAGGHDH
ncbi:FKBP-type peptidyl-prolyl cis-trans isomerase SlyD [Glaciecola punicea ACAM 611]|jgi:FKBP-type peptidyl-prolyl cis-trans isomerase SlyD|uniref:Peptidyl-prolyl cis-trans isomerase n=1 Tax=Glaciecola punicea ACAM 611 TaxID=1121923 RepID=H5T819_9ALTE|nr:peptidylprolyl isomerase [Glaciecola punicea]OFA30648.1 peptidylprolyl isomerase [Glaciecola punicea]GAB54446.1 FKBP-type peptidyl-prolyl cis-trans isomerase SlyD [Glaciecola punicea ACAM 611]